MSVASSAEKPYLIGMEKMRFLYLSINATQASSFPFRHSATRRRSSHALRPSIAVESRPRAIECVPAEITGYKARQYSTACKDPRPLVENCRLDYLPRPEC